MLHSTTDRLSQALIDIRRSPLPNDVGHTVHEFLERMPRATAFYFPGADPSRTRGFVTLLHGNEPSGLQVLHRWIRSNQTPAVNILCVVAAVETAKLTPRFSVRHPASERDLNRCFAPPYPDKPGQLAQAILTLLRHHHLECLVDMHNTSGNGLPFCVTTTLDDTHAALSQQFSDRVIYTDLRLGALMEFSETDCPTVTVECGGGTDPHSHRFAWEGFLKYVMTDQVLTPHAMSHSTQRFSHPVRLEITKDCHIGYGKSIDDRFDITIAEDIEHYNFDELLFSKPFAWSRRAGLSGFSAKNHRGNDILNTLFVNQNGAIYAKRSLRLFMATTNAKIAKSDCLFYLVCSEGNVF